ncbi:hypothetical protein VB779_02705 [Haloarculaceae archaeon H-GB11]|nr:hypothetical protein [Haloarculaceae archaeon H-GB11]
MELRLRSGGAAAILGALVGLDADAECTQTDLAEMADVPLKTLYVHDWLDEMVELGVLVDAGETEDGESCYSPAADSEVLDAARAFEDAFATATQDE